MFSIQTGSIYIPILQNRLDFGHRRFLDLRTQFLQLSTTAQAPHSRLPRTIVNGSAPGTKVTTFHPGLQVALQRVHLAFELFLKVHGTHVGGNAVKAARRNHVDALVFGLLVVLEMHLLHKLGLSAYVHVMRAGLDACLHDRLSVQSVRSDAINQHLGKKK